MPASKSFEVNIDLQQNELIQSVVENGAAFPTVPAPKDGQIFYKNTATKGLFYYSVSQWVLVSELVADDSTLEVFLDSGIPTIRVKDSGITLQKLASIANLKVIGNTSGSSATPSAISILIDISSGADNTNLASAGAIKTYVDSVVNGIGALKGTWAIGNSFPPGTSSTPDTTGEDIVIGDMWFCTGTPGTHNGHIFAVGDILMAVVDNPSASNPSDWDVIEGNKDIATETILGLVKLATSAHMTATIMTEDKAVITPARLQQVLATETKTGLIELATQAEVDLGTDATRAVTPLTLQSKLDDLVLEDHYSATIAGNGVTTSFTVTHNLNSNTVMVQVYKVSTGAQVTTGIVIATVNTVTISFNVAPANSVNYLVVVDK